jgi:RNA polymerase sigma-70 factor (ECF subfamily)
MQPATDMAQTDAAEAGSGDLPDFEEIVRRTQGMVFSMAYHFLHDRPLAEELAQEVFLQLHRHLGELDSMPHVTYWLRRVTANRCIDCARRRKLRPQVGLDSVPEPAALPAGGDPMLSQRLARLVASLPEKARIVVIMRYQEDLDPDDIAAALKMPVRTVKSHLQRSLALLREKLHRSVGRENV